MSTNEQSGGGRGGDPKVRQKMQKIPSGALSRGLALARVSVGAGARAATHALGSVFSSKDVRAEKAKDLLIEQITVLSRELGQLKGSLMKAGQMLSVVGEHFLPPEANRILKSLQSQSPPLEWAEIERVLKRQLSAERLSELEIDPEPIGSASLGQVHEARRRSDGARIALKIQYPGVDEAIDADIRTLRSVLSLSKLIPGGPKFDEIFREVRQMLHQEVDYPRELEATLWFKRALEEQSEYVVPTVFPEYSGKRVLATSLESGLAVDSPEVAALSQARRNRLGRLALELFYRELFHFNRVQTDPHMGNYRVRLGDAPDGSGDQLILFDFGAVRTFPRSFLEPYFRMVRGAFERDRPAILKGASDLGFLREGDSQEDRQIFAEICELFMEPSSETAGDYDWATNDLPARVLKKSKQVAFSFGLRPPPREVVFLDRKMGGIFVMLKVLRCRMSSRELLQKYLETARIGTV